MGEDDVRRLNEVLDDRLGMMTTVVTEATRSAAAAAGAAMEVRGELSSFRAQLGRITDVQDRQADKLAKHGEYIAALKRGVAERTRSCDNHFKDLGDTFRRGMRPAYARIQKQSSEIEGLKQRLVEQGENSKVLDGQKLERELLKRRLVVAGKLLLKAAVLIALIGGGGIGALELFKLLLGG